MNTVLIQTCHMAQRILLGTLSLDRIAYIREHKYGYDVNLVLEHIIADTQGRVEQEGTRRFALDRGGLHQQHRNISHSELG